MKKKEENVNVWELNSKKHETTKFENGWLQ